MSPGFARGTAPGAPLGGVDKEEGYVEIPRFKKRELNLNIVRTRGVWQRLAWIGLWIVWPFNALLGMVSGRRLHASFVTVKPTS
jgi:hypothetical protein